MKVKSQLNAGSGIALTTVVLAGVLLFSAEKANAGFFDKLNETLDSVNSKLDQAQKGIDDAQLKADETKAEADAVKTKASQTKEDIEAKGEELKGLASVGDDT